jgi:hypothetical protein
VGDGAVEAADGDNVLTFLQGVAELLNFFLLLALRANHEEVDNGEEHDHHNDGGHHALLTLLLSLKDNEEDVVHIGDFLLINVLIYALKSVFASYERPEGAKAPSPGQRPRAYA